ncbi:MAG TPA: DUF1800 domain-containing protein, partial [Burkholderiaceae bacterium]|nr:DUF1800 domain-containing protein [Burkholderiaceae bacterium]
SVLAACGGGGGGTTGEPTPAPAPPSGQPVPASISDEQAARFLLQAQFSASDADIASVRATGYAAWLTQQFNAPAGPAGWDWLDSRGYATISSTTTYYDSSYPGDYMVWNQLMTAPDAPRKRVALALSEFFVVSLVGVDFSWRSHAMAAYWDLLAAGAFGNFRKLLEDVTLNAAMGYYLNTKGNQKEDARTGRQPDENYAREVLQLMSIGLYQLNPDGSEKRDADGNKLESYTQSDITNLARVFTGYDFDQSQNAPTLEPVSGRTISSTHFARLPMALNANRHSSLAATFLGTTIAANTEGKAALKTALDTIFNHPNVGPFFGRQMIQRLVTSNPSQAYVARVATAFNNNGAGVRGDLKAVFSAIWLDDEARGSAGLSAPAYGKLREPVLRLVQWGRTFGIQSAQGSWKIGDLSNPATQLGQSPLRSPSVFNFFRPGYVPPSTVLAATQSVAPEFQIVTESSVGGYLNYLQNVVRNGIFVNAPDQPNQGSNASNGFDITAAYTAELALAPDAAALVARLNLLLCAGQLSAATQALIVGALNATPVTAGSSDSNKRNRIAAAVLLTMASAEYLVQK